MGAVSGREPKEEGQWWWNQQPAGLIRRLRRGGKSPLLQRRVDGAGAKGLAHSVQSVIGRHCHSMGAREAPVSKPQTCTSMPLYFTAATVSSSGLSWTLWTGVRAVWL